MKKTRTMVDHVPSVPSNKLATCWMESACSAIINEEFDVCDLCLTHIFRMLVVFADRDLSVCQPSFQIGEEEEAMVGKYGETWKLQASAFKHIMQNICCSAKWRKLAEWWDVLLGVGLLLVIAYFSLSGCAMKCLISLDEKIKVFTSQYSIITIVAMVREQKWNKLTLVNDDAIICRVLFECKSKLQPIGILLLHSCQLFGEGK